MKIDKSGINRITPPTEPEGALSSEKANRAAEAANLSGLSGKDKAQLSDRARLLAKAYTALEQVPEVRTTRVVALKDQVQAGNYQVPYEEVAKRLLAQVRMF